MYSHLQIIGNCLSRCALRSLSSSVYKSANKQCIILGIETSCDDTGCAIVSQGGEILGEALHSQELIHIQHGGIIPPIAEELHRKNIEHIVNKATEHFDFKRIDAIAVTTKPGLPLSLKIGMKFAKYLCRRHEKPLIPIHHMEAHSLTVRMVSSNVDYPFLVLLISGGNCLIALAESVDKFLLLGESIDDAPGEAFDKLARRMKLRNLPEFSDKSGGRAIETAASRAVNPEQFRVSAPMLHYRDCNFSFAGMKNVVQRHIEQQERQWKLAPDEVMPDVYNLAAALQIATTRHLCHRVQRAMEFCELRGSIPATKKQFVVSGGVACNNFITKGLQIVCDELGYSLHRTPPKLCTDNGVMIAWNGVERWQENIGITTDYDSVQTQKVAPLGTSIIGDVLAANLSCKWVKLKGITDSQLNGKKADVGT